MFSSTLDSTQRWKLDWLLELLPRFLDRARETAPHFLQLYLLLPQVHTLGGGSLHEAAQTGLDLLRRSPAHLAMAAAAAID